MPSPHICSPVAPLVADVLNDAGLLIWTAEVRSVEGELTWSLRLDNSTLNSPLLELTRYREQPGLFWSPTPEYPDYQEIFHTARTALLEDKPGYRHTFRVLKNGRTRWLDEVVRIRRLEPGRWTLVGILGDITERKEAEQAERRAAADLRLLLEHADCVLWDAEVVADDSPTWTWKFSLHPSALQRRLFPHQLDQPIGCLSKDYNRHNQEETLARAQGAMRSGATGYQQEFQLSHKIDGHRVWLQEYVTILPIAPGRWRLFGVMLDITRSKSAEAARDEEKRLAAATLDALDEAVLAFDSAGRTRYANPAAARLLDGSTASLLGKTPAELLALVAGEPPAPWPMDLHAIASQTESVSLPADAQLVSPGGEHVPVAGGLTPLRIGQKSFGTVLLLRDISPQRELQARIQELATTESLGVLARSVAHDFNNLLAGIGAQIGLAEISLAADSSALQPLADARATISRARSIAGRLLTFTSGGEPVREDMPLGPLLREVAGVATRGTDTVCDLRMPDDLRLVSADPTQVFQLFHNLFINAVQSMSGAGRIEVEAADEEDPPPGLSCTGPSVRVTVRDHGPGIPPAIRERIFTPFFTTKTAGSGLGLATVASIARRHGGHIGLVPCPAPGACFEVRLPAAREPARPPARLSATTSSPGRARILVMDDEDVLRDSLVAYLGMLDYDVTAAAEGETAIRLYREALAAGTPPDAVILDLTIRGGMGGVETVAALRAMHPAVRAIAISGYSHDPVMADPRRFGFGAAIAKPWEFADFVRILADTLGRS